VEFANIDMIYVLLEKLKVDTGVEEYHEAI